MPKPDNFLSQLTAAFGVSLPGTVTPRPLPRISADVPVVGTRTVELEIPLAVLEDGNHTVEHQIRKQFPGLVAGESIPFAELLVDGDLDIDYEVVNQQDLDAWDTLYQDTHYADGTPIGESAPPVDDDEDDPEDDEPYSGSDDFWDSHDDGDDDPF